jgi:hypothetical protein
MKTKNYFKKLSLALVMLIGFTNFVNAQIPSYVPTNGLVVCYPFSGNANDQSGNSHNGTVTGATLTADRFGNANSAYYFNGTSSYIYAGNIASLAGTSSSVTTVSLWMNSNSLSTVNTDLLDLRSTNNSAMELYYNAPAAGKIQGINYNAPTPNNGIYTTGANTLSINQWYHVVYILNNATGHSTLYVNGVQVGDVTGTPSLLTNPKLNIGSRFDWNNSRCCYFKGAIDDVCFWNRALTTDEITNLYNANLCYQSSFIINTGLLSYNPPTYNNTITMFPNPANDHIIIDCGALTNVVGYHIEIANSLGQVVFNQPMNTQQYTVALNTWSGQGIYFVKVYNASNTLLTTRKLILQ